MGGYRARGIAYGKERDVKTKKRKFGSRKTVKGKEQDRKQKAKSKESQLRIVPYRTDV